MDPEGLCALTSQCSLEPTVLKGPIRVGEDFAGAEYTWLIRHFFMSLALLTDWGHSRRSDSGMTAVDLPQTGSSAT